MATITRSDIAAIAEISTHCDLRKLDIAISEAKEFDLLPLFCDFWDDIEVAIDKVEAQDPDDMPTEFETSLVNGGTFQNCKDRTIKHRGIKAIWGYYAYSRYLILNGFNDTPNGNVSKDNPWSVPKPLSEVQMFADKYRSMGYAVYKNTKNYLCRNSSEFENFDDNDCEKCGCGNDECGGTTQAKGYGLRISKITKRDGLY